MCRNLRPGQWCSPDAYSATTPAFAYELFDDPDSLRHFVGLVDLTLLIFEVGVIHRDSNSTTADADLSHSTVRNVWLKRLDRASGGAFF